MPIYQKRMLKMLSYQKRMLRLLPRPAVGFERIHRCLLDLPAVQRHPQENGYSSKASFASKRTHRLRLTTLPLRDSAGGFDRRFDGLRRFIEILRPRQVFLRSTSATDTGRFASPFAA